jgi:FtsP/CotA-like multicopper oxidase with cupredoxin domain
MYGAFIVDPADPKQDPPFDREYVLQLDEWDQSHVHSQANVDTLVGASGDPETIIDDVYSQGQDIYSNHPTLNEGKDAAGVKKARAWYPMTFPAYFPEYDTYLINGKAFPDTEMLFAEPGEVIRIRLINTGFQGHAIHLHGHQMFITHQDGRIVPGLHQLGDASGIDTADKLWDYAQPVDTVSIGPAQRFDVYVFADNPGPWMIHDHQALAETNDHASPGGMMTMLCYESGWEPSSDYANPCAHAEMTGMSSGEFLLRQTDLLARIR